MLRAMDSAVAGLRSHQNKLDVISNNIANVNTNGYKAQTYNFKEAVYQTATNSTAGSDTVGGTNAAQYGYGAAMGSISTDFTTGTPTYVGGLNAFINGTGFFVTSATGNGVYSDSALKDGTVQFTRVGQFQLNSDGYLTDANGNFVYGYQSKNGISADTTTTIGSNTVKADLQAIRVPTSYDTTESAWKYETGSSNYSVSSISINSNGEINVTITASNDASAEAQTICIGQLALVTFQNEAGLTKSGDNYYTSTKNDNTGTCMVNTPGGDSASLMTGYLEVSNVDLTKEFADMITTQRGFQANSKIITVSDEVLQEIVNMVR